MQFKRLVPFLSWSIVGASFTILDEIHILYHITEHENNILNKMGNISRFISPNYALGGLAFYILYILIVGISGLINLDNSRRGIFGSSPCSPLRLFLAYLQFCTAYLLTGVMSGVGKENGPYPFICALILLIAGVVLVQYTRKGVPLKNLITFLVAVMIVGVSFEWLLVSSGNGFTYGICPSLACLGDLLKAKSILTTAKGSPVALSWLPFLYLHVAIFVHLLLLPATDPKKVD